MRGVGSVGGGISGPPAGRGWERDGGRSGSGTATHMTRLIPPPIPDEHPNLATPPLALRPPAEGASSPY